MPDPIIPYGCQQLDRRDIESVIRVLRSKWLTQGPMVARFEEAFAKYCGARYAVAVSSGTAGLHLSTLALGFKKGEEIVTTPLTFVATANSIVYTGARPVFADIDENSLGLDPKKAEAVTGKNTRGIIPVHFSGLPCWFPKTSFEFKKKGVMVIEDACHALGSEIHDGQSWKKVGGGWADMTVFSFHPVKHITTGEGGMITTNHKDLYERLLSLRSHGIEKNRRRFLERSEKSNPWYYEMRHLGFNYRLTDIQCALGLSQLDKLDAFIEKRREIAAIYDRHFKNIDVLRLPGVFSDRRSSYHLYVLRFDFKKIGKTRAQVMKNLGQRGVGTQVHYIPVTRQPYYRKSFRCQPEDFPTTESYYRSALSIPIYPAMSRSDVRKVIREIKRVCAVQ